MFIITIITSIKMLWQHCIVYSKANLIEIEIDRNRASGSTQRVESRCVAHGTVRTLQYKTINFAAVVRSHRIASHPVRTRSNVTILLINEG